METLDGIRASDSVPRYAAR